jgi:hypothetical protein
VGIVCACIPLVGPLIKNTKWGSMISKGSLGSKFKSSSERKKTQEEYNKLTNMSSKTATNSMVKVSEANYP